MSAVLVLILATAIWLYSAGRGTPAPSRPSITRIPPQDQLPPSSPPPAPAPAPAPPSGATPEAHIVWTDVERQVLDLTNQERAAAHLNPLAPEDTLRETARAQSADMIARHFFDHVNPSGEDPFDRISKAHRRLVGEPGENLWEGTGQTMVANPKLAAVIVDAWMHSPHHRANILNADYTHLGVGVVIEGEQVRATQNFAHVRAWLNMPLPEHVARGALVDLTSQGAPPAAEMFELSLVKNSKAVLGPLPLSQARFDAKPGIYQLHLFYPEGKGHFAVFDGPRVTVD